MKILWISPIPSHPTNNKDKQQIISLGRLLMARGDEITFICSSVSSISIDACKKMSRFWTNFFYVEKDKNITELPYEKIKSAVSLFLADLPDMIICDYLCMTPYFNCFPESIAKVLLPHCQINVKNPDYQTLKQQEWLRTLDKFALKNYINTADILVTDNGAEQSFLSSITRGRVLKLPEDSGFGPKIVNDAMPILPSQQEYTQVEFYQRFRQAPKRILLVCDWPFWDSQYANKSRVLPLIRYLQKWYSVHLYYFGSPTEQDQAELNRLGLARTTVFSGGEPNYHVDFRLGCTREFVRQLKAWLDGQQRFDAVIMEYFYLAPLLEAFDYPLLKILDTLDIMSMRKYSAHENITFAITASQEREVFNKFDAVLIIAREEDNFFKFLNCSSLPVYCPLSQIPHPLPFPKNGIHFGFVGTDWILNTEAIEWFIGEIWRLQDRSDAVLHIFGTVSKRIRPVPANVQLHGVVDSFAEICGCCHVMLSPMLRGSGFPTKSLHALAYGRPLIATRVGARGLAKQSGKGILIARDRLEFVEHMLRLNHDPALLEIMSKEAIQHVNEQFLAEQSYREVEQLLRGY